MNELNPQKAVLFDLDGTLVDSNAARTRSWQQAFELVLHHHFPFAQIRRLIGLPPFQLITHLTHLSSDHFDFTKIEHAQSEIFLKKFLPHLQPLPQVRELMQNLKSRGIFPVAVSSLKRGEFEKLLQKLQLYGSFFQTFCQDDVTLNAENPNLLTEALRKLHLSPHEVHYVTDSPAEIEMARLAEVPSIALRSGGWDDEGLSHAQWILEDPEQLLSLIRDNRTNRAAA